MSPEWTYFVQAGYSGPIKIGATANFERRMKSLVGAHYETLRPLGVLPFEDYPEDRLLTHFWLHRIRGEWFHPTHELRELAQLAGKAWGTFRVIKPLGPICDEAHEALKPWRELCSPKTKLRVPDYVDLSFERVGD